MFNICVDLYRTQFQNRWKHNQSSTKYIQPINSSSMKAPITTLIFDVDDTLYDVGTGFTAHRNTEGAQSFMVQCLNFPTMEMAKTIRDEYFVQYHSTAKALQEAEKDGRFPECAKRISPLLSSSSSSSSSKEKENENENGALFQAQDLAEWWASRLNFDLLGGKDEALIEMFQNCPLTLVAFSNGPRKYVKRVLVELGVAEFFPEERLFAVDDVLPYCKPEKEAFDKILTILKVRPEECVMVEDSMKNIRAAKALGMKTILVAGRTPTDNSMEAMKQSEATKAGDAPERNDPAVDVSVEICSDIPTQWPDLW